jgi:hypothetical protein
MRSAAIGEMFPDREKKSSKVDHCLGLPGHQLGVDSQYLPHLPSPSSDALDIGIGRRVSSNRRIQHRQ